jgi:hypothetical protein
MRHSSLTLSVEHQLLNENIIIYLQNSLCSQNIIELLASRGDNTSRNEYFSEVLKYWDVFTMKGDTAACLLEH